MTDILLNRYDRTLFLMGRKTFITYLPQVNRICWTCVPIEGDRDHMDLLYGDIVLSQKLPSDEPADSILIDEVTPYMQQKMKDLYEE